MYKIKVLEGQKDNLHVIIRHRDNILLYRDCQDHRYKNENVVDLFLQLVHWVWDLLQVVFIIFVISKEKVFDFSLRI